jgi:hypothetical protein
MSIAAELRAIAATMTQTWVRRKKTPRTTDTISMGVGWSRVTARLRFTVSADYTG